MRVKDESKKRAIREVTLAVVRKSGIAGVKMARIANKLGVSPSTLYVYHKSKEDLLVALYLEIFNERLEISKKEKELDLPFKVQLKKKWLSSINFNLKHADELNFVEQMKRSPYFKSIYNEIKQDKKMLFDELFFEGQRQEILKKLDNKILMVVFISSVKSTVELIQKKEVSLKKDADLMFSLFWDAIKN